MTSLFAADLCPLPVRIVWLFTAILSASAQSPPRLLPEAFDLERVVPEGTAVQLPCPVEGDPDTLFFEWHRDREPLDTFGEERYRVQTNGVLRIKSVTPQDTGLYVCRVVNGFGKVDVNVTLIVLGSPDTLRSGALDDDDYEENFSLDSAKVFDDADEYREESFNSDKGKPRLIQISKFQGSVIQRFIGSSITLRCVAKGDPRPQVSWLKNGKPLPDSNLPSNTRRGHWSLILNNLQVSDTGNYTCQVYNGLGAVSASFFVKVIDQVRSKPEFATNYPRNVTALKGDTAYLDCLLQSDVAPHVQWLKQATEGNAEDLGVNYNSVKLFGGFYQVLKSTEVTERPDGYFLSRLIIPVVREENSGQYICIGANSMGFSFKGAFLTVLNRSTSPQLSQQTLSIPFPIVVAIGVSAVIVLIGITGLLLYCRSKRFLPPSSRVTTATNTTSSSKGSMAADVKHSYVGMAYHPQVDNMREDIGVVPSGRMYIPSGQLHRTVPLNSIFL